ncbi:MAG TPA: pitrilysin family protein [Pyrinomonadaceae bacterium]|nr:pitrilysin family protein [Pyrinomonadaceae bacterium]
MNFISTRQSTIGRFILLLFVSLSLVSDGFAQGNGGKSDAESLVTEFDVNGLKVLYKRRPNAPTVSAGLFLRGGARNFSAENAGIEAMMLETAAEASKKFPREVFRKELSRMGSSIGAGVNPDFSVISMASTRQNFDRTWELFTDAALNPAFTPEDFARVKDKALVGLRNRSISPDNVLNIQQERVIYANHPYSNDPSGTIETIGKLKIEDLRDYHQKMMQTSRLLLVIVGDLEPATIKKQVTEAFGKLPQGSYKEQALPQLSFTQATVDVTQRSLPTNYVKGIFPAPSITDPDYHAMRVAITILQSRVYQEVRVRRNLSYAPNAEMGDLAANTANIYVTAVDANQAVKVMLSEIEDMKRSPVSEDIFGGLPGFFLTTYYLGQETNSAQVAELARYELIGGGWRNAFDFLDKIRAVKPEDVQRVSQKYMKNIRFVVIGDPTAVNKEIFLRN